MCALPANPRMLECVKILETGSRHELRELINEVQLVDMRDADNNTLLHHACMLGDMEAVRWLLDAGMHPDVGNVEGHTALCDASAFGSLAIVQLLLQCGVDVNPPSYWGSPLISATQNGHVDVMRLLISVGADASSPDRSGSSPLHLAVCKKFYAGARELLLGGADPNCRTRLTTPLHMATTLEDTSMVRLLLAFGAKPDVIDMHNRMSLDYAVEGSELHQLLSAAQGKLPSLMSMARLNFRQRIQGRTMDELKLLQLPISLLDYLTFHCV